MIEKAAYICLKVYLIISITKASSDDWHGDWFPYGPGVQHDPNSKMKIRINLYEENDRIAMGIKDPKCDDAKSNLDVDWNSDPVNYTCFSVNDKEDFKSNSDIPALYFRDFIPTGYSAAHRCMSDPIIYSSDIPTFGTHRPLWPQYGEYKFLPKQRWLHNLEHGSIVMLYHPCADKNEVNLLRKIVTQCLYRHIITPLNLLSNERPLALLAWGHRLEMSKVSPDIVLNFIREHALKGPEQTSRDGQYSYLLEKHAKIISDLSDTNLCKSYNYMQ